MIKIFTASKSGSWLAQEVLRHSILCRTKAEVSFTELKYFPYNQDLKAVGQISLNRFYVPECCGYQGRAIYLEPETLVFDDIEEMISLPITNKGALARPIHQTGEGGRYTQVMLLDCSRLVQWNLKEWIPKTTTDPDCFRRTLWGLPEGLTQDDFDDLPLKWNQMDECDASTKILNYSQTLHLPWKEGGYPFRQKFLDELQVAIQDGAIPVSAIQREIQWGHVSPKLLEEIKI